MYRAQTEARIIWSYDYEAESGVPANPRVFARVPEEFGLPDGATVDNQGGYWVAMATPPEGGRPGVARYTPDGRMDLFVDIPVPLTTMPAFGGSDLSTLYVTTARLEALMPYATPEVAGSIFAIETGFQGVPETPFRPHA
jgi:sugar lactone lactonase YvrE